MQINDWEIDKSAGRPILVYKGCSVIEGSDAEFALSAIKASLSAAEPVGQVDTSYGDEGMLVASFKPNSLAVGTKLYAAPPAPHTGLDAGDVVEKIFEDLRGRRFLKWIFDARGDECYIGDMNGEKITGLDLEVQEEIKGKWETIIRSALSAQVQDVAGWQLVPKEPTHEMLKAMFEAMFDVVFDGTSAPMIGAGYDAALAAAPAKQESAP
ncbi:hypothetical protein G6L32_07940 [Agrobacterium tumefaciens]|uniref:hypothetical protein n=1 Tax=Agrobacterium tumefaciens TaxID=358 RepID=UPI001573C090|nr:hypothetical protein [Agrobacterium tumefaciens]